MIKKKNYPANLLEYVKFNEIYGFHIDYENLTDDQFRGLEYILDNVMSERSRLLLDLRYRQCMTYKEIAAECNLTENRIHQIFRKIHHKLENLGGWAVYVPNGLEGYTEYLENFLLYAEGLFCGERKIENRDHIYYQDLDQLGLTTYASHSFKRAGIQTVRDLLINLSLDRKVRGVGSKTMQMVYDVLKAEKLISEDFKPQKQHFSSELDNTVRAFIHLDRYTT